MREFSLLLVIAMMVPQAAFGVDPLARGTQTADRSLVYSDSFAFPDSSEDAHRLNVGLMLGKQYLSNRWSPYSAATLLATTCQLRLGGNPVSYEGSLLVAWAGELDANGYRSGPGTSFVEVLGGLGREWHLESLPLSFSAGGGVAYVWGKLTMPDKSAPPVINPAFPDRPMYPDISQDGHFWGGYGRCGIIVQLTGKWYIGLGLFVQLTTNRGMLNQRMNVNSTAIGFFVGAEDK